MDTNGDGSLSRDELVEHFGAEDAALLDKFAKHDTNGDGVLNGRDLDGTKEETP